MRNTVQNWFLLASVFMCVAVPGTTLGSAPITGTIDFYGSLTIDTGGLDTAHGFTGFSNVMAGSGTNGA